MMMEVETPSETSMNFYHSTLRRQRRRQPFSCSLPRKPEISPRKTVCQKWSEMKNVQDKLAPYIPVNMPSSDSTKKQ
jgi:hypothetical protein